MIYEMLLLSEWVIQLRNNNNNTTLFQATAHNTHIQIQHGRIYTVEYVHISGIDNMHSYTIDEL